MSTDQIIKVGPVNTVTVYDNKRDDEYPWTISGDLRQSDYDDANHDLADTLRHRFPLVSFDAEFSCFFAYAPTEEEAMRLVEAIKARLWLAQTKDGDYRLSDPYRADTEVLVRTFADGVFFINAATGGTLVNVEVEDGEIVVYIHDEDYDDFEVVRQPIGRGAA